MSEFVCKKPITLSGCSFSYGEVIPDGFVLPERALILIRSNYITEVESGFVKEAVMPIQSFLSENREPLIAIPVCTEKGTLEVITNSQTVVTVFTIMQKKVEDAEKDIAVLEDENALVLLNAVDARKGIQKAAEERLVQLKKEPEHTGEKFENIADETEAQEKGGV